MARIMAIDFGTKRIGIAVTDPLKIIASGLTTVCSKDVITFLEEYFRKENVECIVVGDPNSNRRESIISKLADDFCNTLKKKFPSMKIDRMDEYSTSKIAHSTMLQIGIKKMARRNKELVDKISATIILQSYLEFINPKKM
ncbi:MAG: Holliday junction resolvase RuvX [Bacteroidota bacterium]